MSFDFYQSHQSLFISIAIFIPLAIFWNCSRKRNLTLEFENISFIQPLPLSFSLFDYVKAFISWAFLFSRLFYIKPGLYSIGKHNESAPVLVTSNNFLTVFLLARRISQRSVRLLVLNTYGINVWCSAAEGKFSTSEIINTSRQFGLIKDGQKTELILPKLCFSGVKLADLHKAGIKPVIGPVYADQVPGYLDRKEFEDRIDDHVTFGLKSRLFTALPTATQFAYYFLGVYIVTFWIFNTTIIAVAAGLAFLYPVLFPYLPGRKFVSKGIALSALASIIVLVFFFNSHFSIQWMSFWILFIFATSIFIALSYTGNSPISNYDSVRKETAQFLPVVAILYLLIIPVMLFL